jgi:hypothetical protein
MPSSRSIDQLSIAKSAQHELVSASGPNNIQMENSNLRYMTGLSTRDTELFDFSLFIYIY